MAAALLVLALQQFPTNPPQIRHAPDAQFAAIIRAVVDDRLARSQFLVESRKTVALPPLHASNARLVREGSRWRIVDKKMLWIR